MPAGQELGQGSSNQVDSFREQQEEQRATGGAGSSTNLARMPRPALTLPRQEPRAQELLGTYSPLSTFAPILQPRETPPLKSSLQIIKLEVRNADTPSESIYLESHKITPRTLIND